MEKIAPKVLQIIRVKCSIIIYLKDNITRSEVQQMNISIRDVDPVAIKKIDELAKKKGISRNEYLKIAIVQDLNEMENRYSNLVDAVVDRLEQANDIIRENSILLEKIGNRY